MSALLKHPPPTWEVQTGKEIVVVAKDPQRVTVVTHLLCTVDVVHVRFVVEKRAHLPVVPQATVIQFAIPLVVNHCSHRVPSAVVAPN